MLELVAALAVVAILVAIGIPNFEQIAQKRRLQGATQRLQQDLLLARSEAIKLNAGVSVMFNGGGTTWCYGMTTGTVGSGATDCDCHDSTRAANCTIEGVKIVGSSDDFSGVGASFGGTTSMVFNQPSGTTTATRIAYDVASVSAAVMVSGLGRTLVCSSTSAGQKFGFQSCP